MNSSIRACLSLAFFILLTSQLFVSEAGAQNILGEILRRMDSHSKGISSLQADLAMTKYDSVLELTDRPMIGSTKYLPKSKITNNRLYARIDWKTPIEEYISVIGDDVTLYRPRLPQVAVGKAKNGKGGSKAGSILGLVTMSREEIKKNYTVAYLGEEKVGPDLTWRLHLTPRANAAYKFAELWVDGDGMPRQVRITEKNADTTTLLLTNIKKNTWIDKNIFEIKYPSSLKPVAL